MTTKARKRAMNPGLMKYAFGMLEVYMAKRNRRRKN